MIHKILRIAILLVCCTHCCYSQDSFFVKIICENKPIENASVLLENNGTSLALISNANGEIHLPTACLYHSITIHCLGYENIFAKKVKNILQENNTINIIQKNGVIPDVIITGQAKTILAEKSIYKINSIGNKQIKSQAAQNLSDVLKNELSSLIQQDNMLGSSINIQGIGGQNIKILQNGVPINGRENGNIDLGQINLAYVERIEYIKGPMSVVYGTDALGGVINIITKAPTANKYKVDIQTYAESINKINANASVSFHKNANAIIVSGGRNFFGGYGFTDSFKRAQTWKPKEQYFANATYTYTANKYKINFSPSYMHEFLLNKGTPTVDAFGAGAIDNHYNTTRFATTISADIELNKTDKLNFSNNMSIYYRTANTMYKNLVTLAEQPVNTTGSQDTTKFTDYNFRGMYNTERYKRLSLLMGYEINLEDAYSLKLVNKTHYINDFAGFISLPITVHKIMTIQPALRYSSNTAYQTPLIPSLNCKIALPNTIVIRASYASGFRAPSLKEMYLNFVDANHNISGNDSLQAERSKHLQCNIDAPLFQKNKNTISINANTFYNNIDKQISLAVVDASKNKYTYANVSNFTNLAQEINIAYKTKSLNASLGTSINTIFKADSNKNSKTTWEILAKSTYVIGKYNTSINFFYRYIHQQLILNLAQNSTVTSYASVGPLHLADINVAQDFFHKKLNVQLGVKNIFNVQSLTLNGSTGDPHNTTGMQSISPSRSVFIGCKYGL